MPEPWERHFLRRRKALNELIRLAWTDPSELKRRFPGKKLMGVFGPYVPWEPILAAGYEPVYLFPENLKPPGSQQLLPPFSCSVSRTLLDYSAGIQTGDIDSLLFVQSCDALQAVADIVSASAADIPVYFFALPRQFSGKTAEQFYQAELTALAGKLGEGSAENRENAAAAAALTGTLLAGLYRYRLHFTAFQFYSLLRAVHFLPKDFVTRHLTKILSDLETQSSPPIQGPQSRLFLIGSHLPGRLILEAVDEAGAQVTGEMIDLGLAAMTQSPFPGEPLPGTHNSRLARRYVLRKKIKDSGADGVLFYRQKYCDPHGFDSADLSDLCRKEKIPFLNLELDRQADSGRISTRLEAFMEMLG